MINGAQEFFRLRTSENKSEYDRATNEEASPEVWSEIINQHPDMRVWVAHNKTVPIEVLEILARDSNPEVRLAVAMRRKLSPELQLKLAVDVDRSVRQALAYNAKVSIEPLSILSKDPELEICKKASSRLRGIGG